MVFGLGFVPLIMAYEYIKNRSKYDREYFAIAISYLISLPVVCYDYVIYSKMNGFYFTLGPSLLSKAFYFIVFVSGTFLLIKGLQIPYNLIIRKLNRKVD